MSDVSGSSSGNKRKGKGRDEEGSDEDTWDSDDDDDTIARIQRAHFAQAAAMRGRRRSNPRPRPMSNKRKLEAVKQFHDFTKKLKKDTGVAIRSLVGNNILELSDFSSEDSKTDSDGLSEEEFVVNPTAVEELNQEDESYIDPETGDFVQSKKSVDMPPKPASPQSELVPAEAVLPEEKKTLSISDIISDGDLDLTKNVEISEVEESELCPDSEKADELLDMKTEENSQDFDITEKLKEMGEISVKPIKKDDEEEKPPSEEEKQTENEEDKKQNSNALNMRRNIRDVMDEKNLDASTLAAQRQESERLARVQEQQRIIREVQRQIAINRQNKIHEKTLSLLQGGSSLLKKGHGKLNLPNTVLVKLPSGEMKKTTMKSGQVEVTKIPKPTTSGASKTMKPDQKTDKKEVVEIVDSSSGEESSSSGSDSDDCIMLSDSEAPKSPEVEEDPHNSGLHVNDTYNTPDEQGRVLINLGHPENEEDIFLAPQIARIIKPHQIGGVRFLFDNIIESVERFSTSTGFGCILAHSMGLGKTLQIVCFCDIFLRHTSSKTVLCIMPINTLQNWVAEFNMWLPLDAATSPLSAHGEVRPRNFPIYVLNDSHKTLQMRAKVVKEWTTTGGVLMIGYELYRLLSMKKDKKPRKKKKAELKAEEKEREEREKNKDKPDTLNEDTQGSDATFQSKLSDDSKLEEGEPACKLEAEIREEMKKEDKKNEDAPNDEDKKLLDEMYEALVKPGPDLVICDEGHRIKNSHSNISYALKQMRTKRRVVLTGYPLQNNLLEYWCMVDFVRPNYLGSKTEFCNMFERPIQNGQCIDSTPQDIRLMRYRAHVLHSLLVGFVQRRSHAVLQSTLPQKEEYVLLVRMTPLQRKLYDRFMNEVVRSTSVPNPLKAFAICCKIWNHPDVLYHFLKKRSEANAAIEEDLDLEELGGVTKAGRAKNGKNQPGRRPGRPKGAPKKPAATIPPNTTTGPAPPRPDAPYGNPPYPPQPYRPDQPGSYPYNYQNQPPGYYPPNQQPYNQNYPSNYYPQQPYDNSYPNQFPQNNPDMNNQGYNQNYWNNGNYYNNPAYYNNPQYPNNAPPQNYTGNPSDFNNQQYPPNYNPSSNDQQPYPGNALQPYQNNQEQPGTSYGNQPRPPYQGPYQNAPGFPEYPNGPPGSYPNNQAPPEASFPNNPPPTGPYPNNQQPSGSSYPNNQAPPGPYPNNQPPPGPYPNNQPPPGSSYPNNQPPPSSYPPNQPPPSYPNQPYPPPYANNEATYGNNQPPYNFPAYPNNIPPKEEPQIKSEPGNFPTNDVKPIVGPGPNGGFGQNQFDNTSPYLGYNSGSNSRNQQIKNEPNLGFQPGEVKNETGPNVPPYGNPGYNYNQTNMPGFPNQGDNSTNGNYPFPSYLETKPPLGSNSSGSPLTSWPLESIKTEVDKLKAEEKTETKSESDGEVKIADLDTKMIVKDEGKKTKEISSLAKENTKKPQDKKEKTRKPKSDASESEDEGKKPKQKGKGKESKKSDKPKPRGRPRLAKGRKDRKTSKEKEDSESEDSEKEEKLNREEELALMKKAEEVTYDWAAELLKDYIPGIIENSSKMELFFYLLNESIKMGDRILLFSQSLFTLNLIEDFLERNYIPGTNCLWERNTNYYRLDGSTHALEREKLINEFNANPNIYLFLVSTRAGSLGINLVGANRVIVFDASWNPCHDTQAVCRVYRYGQKKPCFVYRFVMDWCLEKKIYDRQINKQGMADRVVDECNPDAVLSMKEITNLCFDNDEKESEPKDLSEHKDKYLDVLMQGIIQHHSQLLSKEPFQHESLLVDRKEKKLSSAEKRLAQRGYELEKKAALAPKPTTAYRTVRTADGSVVQRPVGTVRPMQHGARWIPADVWRRQGMTAQEMTLPLDVVIPTNSAEKTNIVLKAGQRVMVLKSPKGIYMQLESGKIIAIKTSFKGLGQKAADNKDSSPIGKKILGSRPGSIPGSLKNNSAITITSKSGPRPGFQRVITRPAIIGHNKITRPLLPGQKIADIRNRLEMRSYGTVRHRLPPHPGRIIRPNLPGSLSITKIRRDAKRSDNENSDSNPPTKIDSDDDTQILDSDDEETEKAKKADNEQKSKTLAENSEDSKSSTSSENQKKSANTQEKLAEPIVLTTDEKLPSEEALEVKNSDTSDSHLSDDSRTRVDNSQTPPMDNVERKINLLKNYRHQRPGSRPQTESSLSILERTASVLNKEGMPDFRRNLDDITQSYSPGSDEKPGTKSKKKKSPNKEGESQSQFNSGMSHSVSSLLGSPGVKRSDHSAAPAPADGGMAPAVPPLPDAKPPHQPYPAPGHPPEAPYAQYPGYGMNYGAYPSSPYYGYGNYPAGYAGYAPPAPAPVPPYPPAPPDYLPPNPQW
ncbi:uncharacterized protein LOC134650318 [Cydia amplana]|uniref:uncharacterized protein LOC134650318 n=1 Tax=Cydia amplana TaxID=1869771 RepID=UPI002FE5B24C